jgi:RHS repeat-associated protein
MDRGGYFYAYLINESPMNVYFDNFQVVHNTGPVLEQNDYYPFGMLNTQLAAQSISKPLNFYKYNGKELQKDLNLELLDYGARFYDAVLGRWHSVDPAIENGHLNYTPYAYVYNNPIRFIDLFGLDSTQRAQAIDKSEEYVDNNPGNSYKRGGKGQPGEGVDCSGMVSNCILAGEEEDPVGKPGATGNGVKQIADGSKEVANVNDVQSGNLIVLDNSESGSSKPYGHIGIITEVVKDKNGNVIGYKFDDSGGKPSSGKSGPRHSSAMINSNYWGKRITGIYKWDTKPDRSASNPGTKGLVTIGTWNPSLSQKLHNSSVQVIKTIGDIVEAFGY